MLSDYRHTSFDDGHSSKDVYVRGEGPAVVVIHEIPGITPKVVRFADWVVDAGFRVYLPLLVGRAGPEPSQLYVLSSIAKVCIRREFAVLAANRSSPVTSWLRALAKFASAETGGGPVGAVGMCFSGNFALAMMLEPSVRAPVLSQPSLPFAIDRAHAAALHVSADELRCVKERCAAGDRVLGLRFKGDPMSPAARFETLRRELGDAFEAIELDDDSAFPGAVMKTPHSVLTEHLVDEAGEPTRRAADRVIAFFAERLRGSVDGRGAIPIS